MDTNTTTTGGTDQAAHIITELCARLRDVLPYAENEAHALEDAARRDADQDVKDQAATAWQAIEAARATLAAIPWGQT